MPRAILIIGDAILITVSYAGALLVRYGIASTTVHWWPVFVFINAVIMIYSYYGLYNTFLYTRRFLLVFRVIKAWFVSCMLYIVVGYMTHAAGMMRDSGFILIFFTLGLALHCVGRVIVAEKILIWYFTVSKSIRRCRFIGPRNAFMRVQKYFENHLSAGLRVSNEPGIDKQACGPDDVFVYSTAENYRMLYEEIKSGLTHGGKVHVASPLFRQLRLESEWSGIDDIPIYTFRKRPHRTMEDLASRFMSIAVAMVSLILLAPFFCIIGIAIKLNSTGPVIYKQKRCGKDGTIFTFYKFRSMYEHHRDTTEPRPGDDETLTKPISKEVTLSRQSVTDVGKILRRASIDEWPQLWNVVKGDMSLVGPRPHCPDEVARYEDWHKDRLLVMQGLTGMWQVYGRGEMPCDRSIFLDLMYVINRSLSQDLRLLFKTIPVVILGKGAY
jgi:lipopolysaccharide/colanic/teichoic acid biosynthesis glycosyltransferase